MVTRKELLNLYTSCCHLRGGEGPMPHSDGSTQATVRDLAVLGTLLSVIGFDGTRG